MVRASLLFLGVAIATFLWNAPEADARALTKGNPFARYNVHGINYGSMRWERKYGKMNRSILGRGYRRGNFRRR